MSIKLGVKTFIFRVLDKLPSKTGFKLYHWLQAALGKGQLNNKVSSSQKTFETFQRTTKKLGIDLHNKIILEIGSGWLPLMPYFFKYFGQVSEIHTYDLNKHYDPGAIKKLNQVFQDKFGKTIQRENDFFLPKGIYYYPFTNIARVRDLKADIVFSRFVLEHVKPDDMMEIHLRLKSSLQPNSYIFHFISPSDHRAYVDSSLSLQDFLKFSQKEWDRIQTKFDYHNRWRLPQYLKLFEKLGFEVVYLNYDVPPKTSKSYQLFTKLDLHPDFGNFSFEELMAGNILIVLKVGNSLNVKQES